MLRPTARHFFFETTLTFLFTFDTIIVAHFRGNTREWLQILFAVQNHVKNSSQAAWAVMNIQMNVFGIPDSNICVSEAMMRQKRVSLNDKWQAQTHTT